MPVAYRGVWLILMPILVVGGIVGVAALIGSKEAAAAGLLALVGKLLGWPRR
jgi:hypothetical protein